MKLASDQYYCPIPPSEQGLQTITADYFFKITDQKPRHMEGLCFDRAGNLYFVGIGEEIIYKLTLPGKELTQVYQDSDIKPTAVKIHRDGRLFVCYVGKNREGGILVMDPDGGHCHSVVKDMDVDDMVFDSNGGFYFNHYVGDAFEANGTIFYMSPDLKTMTPVIRNLAHPNGIALSPDEKFLWVTETDKGRLVRCPVPGTNGHTSIVYHFTGIVGPDSCSIDADGNLYVALFGQGRIMVFNPSGFPVAQILMPNRDQGHNLFTTHAMAAPDRKELHQMITAMRAAGYLPVTAWQWEIKKPGSSHRCVTICRMRAFI